MRNQINKYSLILILFIIQAAAAVMTANGEHGAFILYTFVISSFSNYLTQKVSNKSFRV